MPWDTWLPCTTAVGGIRLWRDRMRKKTKHGLILLICPNTEPVNNLVHSLLSKISLRQTESWGFRQIRAGCLFSPSPVLCESPKSHVLDPPLHCCFIPCGFAHRDPSASDRETWIATYPSHCPFPPSLPTSLKSFLLLPSFLPSLSFFVALLFV